MSRLPPISTRSTPPFPSPTLFLAPSPGQVFTGTALLVATLSDGEHVGRGEGNGVYYLGDDIDHMLAEAQRVRGAIEAGATRDDLQSLLPPGGARHALDCAFWELEAKDRKSVG